MAIPASLISALVVPEDAAVHLVADYGDDDHVLVYRYVNDRLPELVRFTVIGTAVVFPDMDYEAPFDTPVGYAAVGYSGNVVPPAPASPSHVVIIYSERTEAWIKHPGLPVWNTKLDCVQIVPDETYGSNVGTFRPLGRSLPVMVSDVMEWWSADITIRVGTETEYRRLQNVLTSGAPLFLHTSPLYGHYSDYVSITGFRASRRRPVINETRILTISVKTVAYPAGLSSRICQSTFQTVLDNYTTFEDALAKEATFDSMLRTCPEGSGAALNEALQTSVVGQMTYDLPDTVIVGTQQVEYEGLVESGSGP